MSNLNVKSDFPILSTKMNGKPLVYLDNAASTQKPKAVIDQVNAFYSEKNSNIHRGVYQLSQIATQSYDETRLKVANFINARSEKEIVFTSGATESINLVAATYGRKNIKAGDEILITEMEHHANIVPWQQLANDVGATLKTIPMNESGELVFDNIDTLLTEKTKLVAIVHVSNVLGTINPIKKLINAAHALNVPVLVDGSQAVQHMPVDVQDLDADFYVFTGHKLYGPTGIGVLYGKYDLLQNMPPYKTGGDMIVSVKMDKTIFRDAPERFEAGTPNIAGVIGLGAAIDYILSIGLSNIHAHETELLDYATEQLSNVDGLRIIGTANEKAAVISFVIDGIHPHDLGTVLDQEGVALRTGQHCAQPIMDSFGVPATSRISFGMYNSKEDIDKCVEALEKTKRILL